MLDFKDGVVSDDVKPAIWFAIGVAAEMHLSITGKPLVVTALRDGKHMDGSDHYLGLAFDMRTRDLNREHLGIVFNLLEQRLHPLGYQVIEESDHIHIQRRPTVVAPIWTMLAPPATLGTCIHGDDPKQCISCEALRSRPSKSPAASTSVKGAP